MTLLHRLEMACDLWAAGVELKRQSLRRASPQASDAEIDERLKRWLQERPGAEYGDGPQPSDRD